MYEMNEDAMYDAHVEQEAIEAEARKYEKKKRFAVGDHVWIETKDYNFIRGGYKTDIKEYVVIEANTSSAYCVAVDKVDAEKPYRYRIDQRKRAMHASEGMFGWRKILWESREAYDAHYEQVARRQQLAFSIKTFLEDTNIEVERLEAALKVLSDKEVP